MLLAQIDELQLNTGITIISDKITMLDGLPYSRFCQAATYSLTGDNHQKQAFEDDLAFFRHV